MCLSVRFLCRVSNHRGVAINFFSIFSVHRLFGSNHFKSIRSEAMRMLLFLWFRLNLVSFIICYIKRRFYVSDNGQLAYSNLKFEKQSCKCIIFVIMVLCLWFWGGENAHWLNMCELENMFDFGLFCPTWCVCVCVLWVFRILNINESFCGYKRCMANVVYHLTLFRFICLSLSVTRKINSHRRINKLFINYTGNPREIVKQWTYLNNYQIEEFFRFNMIKFLFFYSFCVFLYILKLSMIWWSVFFSSRRRQMTYIYISIYIYIRA